MTPKEQTPSESAPAKDVSTIKLYYTEDGRLLYSRNWPEVPSVQLSIYKDMAMMAAFERRMDFLLRCPVVVTNPDIAKGEIVWSGRRIEPGEFYEIQCEIKITGPNTCEVIQRKP